MDLTRFAITNDRITFAIISALLIGGLASFFTMEQSMDPGFTIRTAQVITRYPGANPDRVEALVTDKIEKAIQELAELDFVTSTSRTGISIVGANIRNEFIDVRPIWDKLRRKIDDVARTLPEGVQPPEVNDEFGDVYGTLIALTGDGFEYPELKKIALQLRDRLLRLSNTGKVDILGEQDERVFVEYSDARLAELGLSVAQLADILQSRNILASGGSILAGEERIALEPSGNFDSVRELANTIISIPGRSGLLYLRDIAQIKRGFVDPPSAKVRANGKPALMVAVSLREGGNVVTLGDQVQGLLAQVRNQYPVGIDFEVVAFEPERVEAKVNDFSSSVIQAVVIVLISMLLMLGLRTGLVVATLVPSALLTSLMVMQVMGLGLNQMTLASLIIALGMLVDNAIVMSESIMVSMSEGMPPIEAAVASARELRIPLLTSSLTTSAAFLPIFLAEGPMGEYTGVLFVVVTITLLSSWILALTMIPLLCSRFLRVPARESGEGYDSRFYRIYRGFLQALLRFRLLSLLAVLFVFYLALQGFGLIPNVFFPPDDTPMMTAEFEGPIGTSFEHTERFAVEFDAFVASELAPTSERPEGVVSWSTYVGQGAPRFILPYGPEPSSPEYAYSVLNVTSADLIPSLGRRIEEFCAENYPSLVADVGPLPLGSVISNPVEVRISGDDRATVFALVEQVKAKLQSIEGSKNVVDDWGARSKKLAVNIDGFSARRSGISHQDVATSLQSVLSGYAATEYREGTEIIPVTIRSVEADRQDIGKLESLNIRSPDGKLAVPLKQLADLEVRWQPAKLLRRNRLTTVTVSCALEEGVTAAQITGELIPWLEAQQPSWPPGALYEIGGELEESAESEDAITVKLPYAGLFILLLLIAQFNSFRRPLIILLTIPLSLVGVVIGLIAANSYFGFMTFLGLISLAGIVINNAIVLIDRIGIEINENGLDPPRAVIEAAQRRLRPILLTTVTTVGGLIPLWLGGGPMWESMAIAVIFGLVFATLLTLGVVPVLYSILFRVSFKGFRYDVGPKASESAG